MTLPATESKTSLNLQGGTIDRSSFLKLLALSLDNGEHRFALQAALQWLALYPGDLAVALAYAKALLGSQQHDQAVKILKGLSQVDPEFLDVVRLLAGQSTGMLAAKTPSISDKDLEIYNNWQVALSGENQKAGIPKEGKTASTDACWGEQLWVVFQALDRGEVNEAESDLHPILALDPATPLIAVSHLKVLNANPDAPIQARLSLGEHYLRRWPDCLPCKILLSTWLLESGAADRALPLLHQAAIRDIGGQVITRLLGKHHPYRGLWPAHLEMKLNLSVPPSVYAGLGYNRLGPGNPQAPEISVPAATAAILSLSSLGGEQIEPQLAGAAAAQSEITSVHDEAAAPTQIKEDEEILSIKAEFDRLAKSINQPPITQTDGRFPTYVILSAHSRLEAQYGPTGAADIETMMNRLAYSVTGSKSNGMQSHWAASVYLADRAESATELGIAPVKTIDAWSLKLALKDLDAALGKHGQMIGALLIVGGPEIIPFHQLPNPVDDPDAEVLSDNPYATRDDNYFIPEWPVGRIPGGTGNNPRILINALQRINNIYTKNVHKQNLPVRLFRWLISWRNPAQPSRRKSFGYSAAVWRQASASVFQPVGDAKNLAVSPPFGISSNGNGSREQAGQNSIPKPTARLGYFNLHGLADSSDWYGQRESQDEAQGPDYPVALRPGDIQNLGAQIPQVIFSEACYGTHIQNKAIDGSLALQFLASGCQAIVGSTCMSYGSIQAPLIAADLLGNAFWKGLQAGSPAGESLRKAKIALAAEMHARQGYLDGEDQKTLISFVLLGDPLAHPNMDGLNSKWVLRSAVPQKPVPTICDRAGDSGEKDLPLAPDTLTQVKKLVADYLPGLVDASIFATRERQVCQAHDHSCPTHQLDGIPQPRQAPSRKVIVVSKSNDRAGHKHPQVARLTLDNENKLVKLVVSR